MDQFVVETGDDRIEPGETAILFGTGEHDVPTAQDWAEAADTIAYEIVTRIGGRVSRRYVGSLTR
jgi:alanine racemase